MFCTVYPGLEDQDKQQIRFFVIHFSLKYSDRLVATASLEVLDFQFVKVLGSVRLSLRLGKILVQFVTFRACLPGGRVTLASGLILAGGQKIARVYKQNFTGRVTLQPGTT